MNESLSRRKRIVAMLGVLSNVRGNMPSRGEYGGGKGPGSLVLVEDHPGFASQDDDGNPVYAFHALEQAIADLKQGNKRAYLALWRVYCEGGTSTPRQRCWALVGLKAIESSRHMPEYVKLPQELRLTQERPSTHAAKKAQNEWIRELRDEGMSQRKIARLVGVTHGRIAQILGAEKAA